MRSNTHNYIDMAFNKSQYLCATLRS